jgi:hypothetical protein
MGDLGTNPLIIDAEDKAWYALEFNGMHDTDAVVEWAKENSYTIIPVCSFAQKYLKKIE